MRSSSNEVYIYDYNRALGTACMVESDIYVHIYHSECMLLIIYGSIMLGMHAKRQCGDITFS